MNTAAHHISTKERRLMKAGAALSAVIALSVMPITVANASTPAATSQTLSANVSAVEPSVQPDIPTFVPVDQSAVDLGAGGTYGAFGGALVRNTGTSALSGDVGVGLSENISGLETSDIGGSIHAGDAHAIAGSAGFGSAYDLVTARTVDANLTGDLYGTTFDPGTYAANDLTVDRVTLIGDATSVFVFKVDNALTFRPGAIVTMQGGVKAENVIWYSEGSITIGANAYIAGVFLADEVLDAGTGSQIFGRLFARDGDLVMDSVTVNSTAAPTGTTPAIDPAESPAAVAAPAAPSTSSAPAAIPGASVNTTAATGQAETAVLAATGTDLAAPSIAAGLLLAFGGLLFALRHRIRKARAAAHFA